MGAVAAHTQVVNQRLLFEIDRHQAQVSGQLNTPRVKTSPLPRLRGGMIHFKDVQNLCKFRSAVGERVQPCAKYHVLGNTSSSRQVNLVLEVAAPGDNSSCN